MGILRDSLSKRLNPLSFFELTDTFCENLYIIDWCCNKLKLREKKEIYMFKNSRDCNFISTYELMLGGIGGFV